MSAAFVSIARARLIDQRGALFLGALSLSLLCLPSVVHAQFGIMDKAKRKLEQTVNGTTNSVQAVQHNERVLEINEVRLDAMLKGLQVAAAQDAKSTSPDDPDLAPAQAAGMSTEQFRVMRERLLAIVNARLGSTGNYAYTPKERLAIEKRLADLKTYKTQLEG